MACTRFSQSSGCGRRSVSRRQLQCSLLLFLVLTSCRGDGDIVQQETQQDCMMQWLLSIGISQNYANTYHASFSSQLIDQRSLRLLSDNSLKDLGVAPMGHRVLMLDSAQSGMGGVCRYGGSCELPEQMGETCSYTCRCKIGFSGDRCEIVDVSCRDNPCQNGATCSEGNDSTIVCTCPPSYHGDLCQHHTSDCLPLARTVANLTSELQELKEADQTSTLLVYDTMRKSTGLRFFKLWLEIDNYGATFILHFNIGCRAFIGVVIRNFHRHAHQGVVIYEIVNSERLVEVQVIGNVSATSFKVFEHRGRHLMVVGNHYDPANIYPPPVSSKLYVWNETMCRFVLSKEIQVYGIKDVDAVTLSVNHSFIALAAHDYNLTYAVPTYIYRYYPPENAFIHFTNLRTTAATRVNFFVFNSTLYLFVAEEYSADGSYHTNSSVYMWNSKGFVLIQEIDTIGAYDLLPFSIGDCFFVVAVNNRHNYSLNIQSKVYLMTNGVFNHYTSLDTRGATKAEFFRIGFEYFLVFSNSQDDVSSVITHSIVYHIEGAKFVCFQEILTRNAMFVHFFHLKDNTPVLAIANKAGKPTLYKWTSLSYSCPEGNC